MHNLIKTLLLFGLAVIGFATTEINDQETTAMPDRKPIILLQEITHAPHEGIDKIIWKLGFLNPNFVLYDDGLVIFKSDKDQFELFSVELTPQEMNTLLEEFRIDEFLKLEDSYYTNNQFHQPLYFIKYWQGRKMKKVRVIGPIRDNEADRNIAPKAFLKIFDKMISFHHKNARLWEPEKIEIALYPYTNSQGEPVPWTAGWPDLSHKTTKKRTDVHLSHSYTIYLDGANKDKLEQMLFRLKKKQAVLINQKQWYIAPQRYILPNEEMWDTEKSE